MTDPRYQVAVALSLTTVLVALIGCKSESPSTTTSAPAKEAPAPASEAPACRDSIPVTADNFIRAETDKTFDGMRKRDSFGKFNHFRELSSLDSQIVARENRDTLYSVAVFDLDAGPVTITLPDTGKRFMTMIVIDEDHYVHEVVYGAGSYSITKEKIGTRYVLAAIRILVDPANPKDVEQVHGLQDAVKVSQKSPGNLEMPNWDPASQKNVRDALVVLGATLPDLRKAFGSREQVDPVRHLIATATAWGGNPDKDAVYLNVTPSKNDGETIYKLNVKKDVPVDGFWSISVYTEDMRNAHDRLAQKVLRPA